jgi:uncharacterized protein (DUF2062 family)
MSKAEGLSSVFPYANQIGVALKTACVGLAVILFASVATCQNIQVTGGDSSLFGATGAEVKTMFAKSETDLSGGVLNGRAYFGVNQKMSIGGWDVTGGDVRLPFNLVTDFNNGGLQFPAIGIVATRKTDNDKLTVFTGATAESYQVPFFFGSRIETPTAGLFYERVLTPRLSVFSSDVISTEKQSGIQSLRFKTGPTSLAMSAGVGANSPFFSLRAGYETFEWTGVVSWTKRSDTFERIVVPNYSVAEDNGLDFQGGYRSQHFNAQVSRQNLLSDVSGTVYNSTVNSINAGAMAGVFSTTVTGFYGTTNGKTIEGETAGAAVTVGFLTARVDAYRSVGLASESVTMTEKLARHFSVNQFVTGLHSVNAGAEYRSNSVTMSGGYAMSFFPALGLFQRVLSVSLSIQLPHNLRIDGGTVTTPDGRTRWTGYANSYTHGPLSTDVQLGSGTSTGKRLYQGRCVTQAGAPVACAVRVGKVEVFAGDDGVFRLPTNKKKASILTIAVEDFMAPGKWAVVSAPTVVEVGSPVHVVVRRDDSVAVKVSSVRE